MALKKDLRQLTIKELSTRLRGGDIQAFDAIYHLYSKRLYAFVIRYVEEEDAAEDIVQEVFIKIWENKKKIASDTSFDSFMFTITYNAAISYIRRRAVERKYFQSLQSVQGNAEGAVELRDELNFKELNSQIEFLLDKLTPRQKEIFYMSREEGLTHREIAQKLNISVHTVKNHVIAVLSFLRSHIKHELLCYWLMLSLLLLR